MRRVMRVSTVNCTDFVPNYCGLDYRIYYRKPDNQPYRRDNKPNNNRIKDVS